MSKLINLNTKKPFEIKDRGQDKVELVLYSAIGESFWEDTVSAKDVSEELKKYSNAKQIDVRINSPGGDVFDGIAIYNRLKQHKANVTVYVDGLAASIASIIALAADEVIMSEGSLMMIHKPWTVAAGNSNELEDTISRLDDVEEQLLAIYQKKTRIDRSELRSMLAEEKWMDSAEAVELGFADRTMETEDKVDMAASLDKASWIKRAPKIKSLNDDIKKKLDSFKEDIEGFLARK